MQRESGRGGFALHFSADLERVARTAARQDGIGSGCRVSIYYYVHI